MNHSKARAGNPTRPQAIALSQGPIQEPAESSEAPRHWRKKTDRLKIQSPGRKKLSDTP